MNVGLIGATGYAGIELVKIIDRHPHLNLKAIGSRSHINVDFENITRYPLINKYTLIGLDAFEEQIDTLDIVFLSLPHGTSMQWVEKIHSKGIPVIDLSGDFRLDSQEEYEAWYKTNHTAASLLDESIYGLVEHSNCSSKIIANPGCYPTASLLGLLPLAYKGLLNNKTVIIDAKSGMSGAGKKLNESVLYCESNESMRPYGTGSHRHTPEIELALKKAGSTDTQILFSPSVVPMERGILASIYIPMDGTLDSQALSDIFSTFYSDKPFVRLIDKMPETKWVKGTNFCDIHLVFDERTNTLIIHSAIDNLMKGAAGQAIQNANIMFGFNETDGLL